MSGKLPIARADHRCVGSPRFVREDWGTQLLEQVHGMQILPIHFMQHIKPFTLEPLPPAARKLWVGMDLPSIPTYIKNEIIAYAT